MAGSTMGAGESVEESAGAADVGGTARDAGADVDRRSSRPHRMLSICRDCGEREGGRERGKERGGGKKTGK